MAGDEPFNLAQSLNRLKPKDKLPRSANVLNNWIAQAEKTLSSDGGRLGWLAASTVVAAALQQAVDQQGRPHWRARFDVAWIFRHLRASSLMAVTHKTAFARDVGDRVVLMGAVR